MKTDETQMTRMTSQQIQAAAQAIDRVFPWPGASNHGPVCQFEDGSFAHLISVEAAKAALEAAAGASRK